MSGRKTKFHIGEPPIYKIKFLIMKYFYAAGNVILHGTRHLIVLDSHVTGYSNVLNIKFRLFKNLGIFHSNGIKSRDKHTFYSDMIKTKIFNNFNSSYIINQFNFSWFKYMREKIEKNIKNQLLTAFLPFKKLKNN